MGYQPVRKAKRSGDGSEGIRISRPRGHESVELHTGATVRHGYPRHWHEEFYLGAITAGAGHYHFRGSEHRAVPGTLVYIAPGEVHTHSDGTGGRSFRSLHMSASFVEEMESDLAGGGRSLGEFPSCCLADVQLFREFLKLHRLLEGRGLRLERDADLCRFFAEVIPRLARRKLRLPAAGREQLAVRRAHEYLHERYHQEVPLKDLANVAGLSPYHFHRVFCRETGIPPHGYQIQLRILRARGLLRKGCAVAQVALLTGFTDQSHFTRHFKRSVGVTPAVYAAASKIVLDATSQHA